MKPFLSIIIPTLNEEKFIPQLLSDLQKQKEKNFEVIIVDGRSEDHTRNKVLMYKNILSMTFFENDKKNVAYQKNFGAHKSNGSFLVFLDADARIKRFFTQTLQKNIQEKKGLVFLPYNKPDEKNSQAQFLFKFINYLVELSQSTGKPFSTMGMIFEKDFFQIIGGFDEQVFLAEDHKIIQEAHEWGVRAKLLNNIKVTFSLRRMRREGYWSLFYKYLVATAHILFKGDIKKKIYDYEMGGKTEDVVKESYLQQLKKFFRDYLR